MSAMQPTRSELSIHLSRVLDGVGVSERTVNKRRQTLLMREKTDEVYREFESSKKSKYLFGSQIEGSTTHGLHSDVDELHNFTFETAIQSMHEWKHESTNYLILQGEDIPAGYCRLQLLSNPCKLCIERGMNVADLFAFDDKGRLLLKHRFFTYSRSFVHGPASSVSRVGGISDNDYVYGLKCDSVSKQVEPWIRRMQNKQWPTRDMLNTAKKSGHFLVPVGHRLSETRDIEWRVSPSLTERCLMLGMNITQIKTYVILKMIKRDLIIPNIGESISSFHLKTALFHCVENTPTDLWKEEHLIFCIEECLKYLLSCVQKRSCPNFLIPGENLFSGRIPEMKVYRLSKLLHELIESAGLYLFEILCDEVGLILNLYINRSSIIHPEKFMLVEGSVLGWCEYAHIHNHQLKFHYCLKYASDNQIKDQLVKLRTIENCSDADIKSIATSFIQLLSLRYGSVLASRYIHDGIGPSQDTLSFLEQGCGFDLMSGRLKKASVLYCCDQYTEAASVLEDLDSMYDSRCVQPVCDCNADLSKLMKPEFCRRVFSDNKQSENNILTACHVTFTAREIHCCPLALRFDMFRGVGDDRALRRTAEDAWMDMAAVDSVIFLYFLKYLTYGSMGNRQLQRHSLNSLISSLSTKEEHVYIRHYETALNLLGQCYEMEGKPDNALLSYRLSLQWLPRNNSASWLVVLLMYKFFRHSYRDCNVISLIY